MLETKRKWTEIKRLWIALGLILFTIDGHSQVKTFVDSTAIKIGEELIYNIELEVDSSSVVVFPKGQPFGALELIEDYKTDTIVKDFKVKLLKKYGLTLFDSGRYTIPAQKVLIDDKILYSDSVRIEINAVKIDTVKQNLYGIKPIIAVEKQSSFWNTFKWIFGMLLVAGIVIWYFFFYAKKTLSNAEQIAKLPPYEQAKLALNKLNEKTCFENENIKVFYSELTLVLRKYLNAKVYDQSLESTTEELLEKLYSLKRAEEFMFKDETLKNIETTLKRADLVKFAKSKPQFEIMRMDKQIIAQEIDQVRAGLPKPSEIELQQTLEYQKGLRKRKKQQQFKWAGITLFTLSLLTFLCFGFYFGFNTVKDTVLRHPSKLLLQNNWVSSEYGAPGIRIESPKVLLRDFGDSTAVKGGDLDIKKFYLGEHKAALRLIVKSTKLNNQRNNENDAADVLKIAESELLFLGQMGASNILPKNEEFTTPNGQKGLKTYGNANFIFKDKLSNAEFVILGFSAKMFLQQLILIWDSEDPYATQISERILSSVELNDQTQI